MTCLVSSISGPAPMRGPHPGPPRPDMPGPRMPMHQPGPVRPEGAFQPGPGGGDFGHRGPPPGGPRGPPSDQGPRPGMGPEPGPRPMGAGGPGPLPGPGHGPGPRPGHHFPDSEIRPPHGMGPAAQLPPRVRLFYCFNNAELSQSNVHAKVRDYPILGNKICEARSKKLTFERLQMGWLPSILISCVSHCSLE